MANAERACNNLEVYDGSRMGWLVKREFFENSSWILKYENYHEIRLYQPNLKCVSLNRVSNLNQLFTQSALVEILKIRCDDRKSPILIINFPRFFELWLQATWKINCKFFALSKRDAKITKRDIRDEWNR